MTQKQTLYYHEYCIGHGFQTAVDEMDGERCNQCGDTSVRYQFSFESKDDFVKNLLINDHLWYKIESDDDSSYVEMLQKVKAMSLSELKAYFDDDYDHCASIYNDLIENVL